MKKINKIIKLLEKEYPNPECSLEYKNTLHLLIATQLAAQCTDARVNMVTPALFKKYPDAKAFADAKQEELEEAIKSTGFYHNKARNIIACCKKLCEEFDGTVPGTMEELLSLPGVGRKTANLVLGDAFGKPAVVVDTHCIRITRLIGITQNKEQEKIEKDLREILPPDKSNDFCHRMVMHGRAVCIARRPQCDRCVIKELCDYGSKQ